MKVDWLPRFLLLTGLTVALQAAAQLRVNVFDTDIAAGQYYRIPAIVQLDDGRLLAIADDRHGSDYDIGGNWGIDIVGRMSDDQGKTWGETILIADGDGLREGFHDSHGDAAAVVDRETGSILIMCASGKQGFLSSTLQEPLRVGRYISNDGCLYRFYKWSDYTALCQRLADVYSRMDSLENLFVPGEPLEMGVLNLCREFEGVNGIPVPGSTSANKRLYMFLRWMVRKGSPVDFGIWSRVTPAQLLVPVDTHVYATAKALGLTSRSSADLKTSAEITGQMARIWPDDPARGDFALYGSQVM